MDYQIKISIIDGDVPVENKAEETKALDIAFMNFVNRFNSLPPIESQITSTESPYIFTVTDILLDEFSATVRVVESEEFNRIRNEWKQA